MGGGEPPRYKKPNAKWLQARRTQEGTANRSCAAPSLTPTPQPSSTRSRGADFAARAAPGAAETKVGVAFSGGGIRAYTYGHGFLRGLYQCGALEPKDGVHLYLSGSSGGGWCVGCFCFNQSSTLETLLATERLKYQLKDLTVKTMQPRPAGAMVTASMTKLAINLATGMFGGCVDGMDGLLCAANGGGPLAQSWQHGIYDVFLAPFGVPYNKEMAGSPEDVERLITESKGKKSCCGSTPKAKDFVLPAPYTAGMTPIVNMTMYGPRKHLFGCGTLMAVYEHEMDCREASREGSTVGIDPLAARRSHNNASYTNYMVTPSAVFTNYDGGAMQVMPGSMADACRSKSDDTEFLACHVESVPPSKLLHKTCWEKLFPCSRQRFSVEDALATGSMLLSADLQTPVDLINQSWMAKCKSQMVNAVVGDLMPIYNIESSPGRVEPLQWGDGGNFDNLAAMALLQQGMSHVVALMATPSPFLPRSECPPEWSDERYWAACMDYSVSSYFGVKLVGEDFDELATGYPAAQCHVFNHDHFLELLDQFEACLAAGKPLIGVLEDIEVLPNDWFGISAGRVTFTVVYNQAPQSFLDRVPAETITAVLPEGGACNTPGNFPYFPTTPGTLKGLSSVEAHLLADMSSWTAVSEWPKLSQSFPGAAGP